MLRQLAPIATLRHLNPSLHLTLPA
jgi:hypothetical protein